MKGLGNSIKHPLFKYAMYILAVINLYTYTIKKKFNCLLSFVAAVMVTHYFIIKNIPFALLVGLIISSFVLGCGKILEGNTLPQMNEDDQWRCIPTEHPDTRYGRYNKKKKDLCTGVHRNPQLCEEEEGSWEERDTPGRINAFAGTHQ